MTNSVSGRDDADVTLERPADQLLAKLTPGVPRKAEASRQVVVDVPGQIGPGEGRAEEPQCRVAEGRGVDRGEDDAHRRASTWKARSARSAAKCRVSWNLLDEVALACVVTHRAARHWRYRVGNCEAGNTGAF